MSNTFRLDEIYAETVRVFTDREQSSEPLTTSEVSASLDCGRRATHKRLQTLVERDVIRTKKVGASARVWWHPTTDTPTRDRTRLQDLLTNAERLGGVGAWEYNVDTETLLWTAGTRRIHDVDTDYEPTLQSALSFYHPEDRPQIRQLFENCVDTGTPFSTELQLHTAAEEKRWVRISGEAMSRDGDSLVRGYIQDITAQKEHQQVLETQREHLEALNSLNSVVRQLTDAVLDQSTRSQIEATTCEKLSASDSYRFAWIATIDPVTLEFIPRAEHGVDGYLDATSLSANPVEPGGKGPAGRAVRTREMQFSQDVFSDPEFEPWLELAETYDYASMAVMPIVYEETMYGVLGIYSDRVGAFTEPEREVLEGIGEVVGHAISAVEHKQALLSDEVVELSFRLDDTNSRIGLPTTFEGSFDFDSTLPLGDGVFLVYCTAHDVAVDDLRALDEADSVRYIDDVTLIGEDTDGVRLEVRMVHPPMLSTVANEGGYVSNVTIANGTTTMTVHLAAERDVSGAVDHITDVEPGIEMLRRRQTTRPNRSLDGILQRLPDPLTDRQQAALEAAYFAGYFDWPRESSGSDVADTLNIGSSTFHQHLRKAERKILDAVFE